MESGRKPVKVTQTDGAAGTKGSVIALILVEKGITHAVTVNGTSQLGTFLSSRYAHQVVDTKDER